MQRTWRASLVGISDADLASSTWESANLTGRTSARNPVGHQPGGRQPDPANLAATDFSRANLKGAILAGVGDADLKSSLWTSANLSGVNLSGRILGTGDGSSNVMDLTDVNLTGANLMGTDLRGVPLTRTNLSDAILVRRT